MFKRLLKNFIGKARSVGETAARIIPILGGRSIGYWSSDHAQESKQYDGHVYCAVSTILDQVVQAKIKPDEVNQRDNPLFEFFHEPNPYQGLSAFNELRAMQLLLTGVCITWDVPNGAGQLVDRYVLPTALARPTREGFRFTFAGMQSGLWSEYPLPIAFTSTELIPYANTTVIRLPDPIVLGDGKAPVSAGARWIDVANQIDTSRFAMLQNGMRPASKVIETADSELEPEDRERFKAELKAIYSSPEKSGESLYVPRGLVMEPWSLTSAELDHYNSFLQMRDAVFGLFRVPPVAAGIMEASSHAEFYAAMLQLTELRVQPICDRLIDGDKATLRKFRVEYPEEISLRAKRVDDPDQRQAEAQTMKAVGGFTPNEIRKVLGYPPIDRPEMNEPILGDGSKVESKNRMDESTTGIEEPM